MVYVWDVTWFDHDQNVTISTTFSIDKEAIAQLAKDSITDSAILHVINGLDVDVTMA